MRVRQFGALNTIKQSEWYHILCNTNKIYLVRAPLSCLFLCMSLSYPFPYMLIVYKIGTHVSITYYEGSLVGHTIDFHEKQNTTKYKKLLIAYNIYITDTK